MVLTLNCYTCPLIWSTEFLGLFSKFRNMWALSGRCLGVAGASNLQFISRLCCMKEPGLNGYSHNKKEKTNTKI